MAVFEGVCERVFGRTFALQSHPEYLGFFRRCAVPWVPDFFHAPSTRGTFWPTSGCWPLLQVSWGRVSWVPSSFPWPALPGGSDGDSHSLWQVVHCSPPSEARGASRRRSTSVAASVSSLPAALARRAPTAGVRLGGASKARPTRSAARGPRGRHFGPAASCARASPSLSPVGGPGF